MGARKKQALICRAEQWLALPAGTLSDTPRLELNGCGRLLLEGRCEIRGCGEDSVLLQTGAGALRLRGQELCIVSLTENGLELTGKLISLEFLE